MIRTKSDLKYYLTCDRIALSIQPKSISEKLKNLLFPNEIYKFERLLRHTEYYYNTQALSRLHKILYLYYKASLREQSLKLGFSIPLNVCGPGLSIAHYGTIVISENAKIGANCHIHTCVNIGASAGRPEAPKIGDNVYLGPGAILFGDIKIANNVTIGANATVNKSCEEEYAVLAGSPATVIKHNSPNWLEFNNMTELANS